MGCQETGELINVNTYDTFPLLEIRYTNEFIHSQEKKFQIQRYFLKTDMIEKNQKNRIFMTLTKERYEKKRVKLAVFLKGQKDHLEDLPWRRPDSADAKRPGQLSALCCNT